VEFLQKSDLTTFSFPTAQRDILLVNGAATPNIALLSLFKVFQRAKPVNVSKVVNK
jgi:hypothetical protein